MLEPEIVEQVEGRAEVRRSSGWARARSSPDRSSPTATSAHGGVRVYRNGKLIATDKLDSLRRFRDDVRDVAQGYECGIGLAGFHDLAEGDIIEAFTQQSVSRASLR